MCVCLLIYPYISWCEEKVSCFLHCLALIDPMFLFAGGQVVLRPISAIAYQIG